MTKPSENNTVQSPLIRHAVAAGWEYVPRAEAVALRKGEGGLYFYRVLEEKLRGLNPGLVTASGATDIIRRMEGARNTIEGNAEILAWLRGEKTVHDPKENRERNVALVDYRKPGRNVFQVTEEWQFTNGRETNRADVMFLINGIPVAIVEAKSAARPEGIEEALDQMRRYHRETPEMLTAPQVFNLTHLIDFHYGATWNLERKNLFNWRDEEPGNFEKKVKAFFDPGRFLGMLKEWILFFYKDDELRKTILRQHQTRAVERILARCADPGRTTGLVWHTQGAGKTFTMIAAARRILLDRERFGKATVLLIIDRNELEGQLAAWVERLIGEAATEDIAVEPATSKRRLRGLLEADFRGLIVTMIHKFDGIPKGINARENIFVLVDEAHRTTGGDLGTYLLAALPKATVIGFTGTPIDRTAYGRGTFKVFGREDEQGYLDKYSIVESIADGTTKPLKYTLAPGSIRVPQEQLEAEFLNLAQAEGVSDIDDLNRILDRALRLKTFLKGDDRIDKVAAFVARHFKENVEPLGYKAFLVAVDREACALYKEALDKLLPPETTLPIYTSGPHDSERLPLVHRHQIAPDAEKKARRLFPKADTQPGIFIVTDKLLTGFDAPILYCMYLDKPMRDHVLLQAIARVNRPYERDGAVRKPCGVVVDFVGIFEKLEKALAFDSDVVSGVIEDLDRMLARFTELMAGPAREYLGLCRGPMDDKTVERAMDAFADPDKRQAFFRLYRQIEMLYEILSPSPDLRDYVEDFACLALLHQIVRNAFRKKTPLYGELARKTEVLVRERVASFGLDTALPAVPLDEQTLKVIRGKGGTDNGKIINLVATIRNAVEQEGEGQPYLKPIGVRAEAIMDGYSRRQVSTEAALKKVEQLVLEALEARAEQQKMGMEAETFAFYWTLRQENIPNPERTAEMVHLLVDRFPHHRENAAEFRQLKAELYRVLLPVAGKDRMVALADQMLGIRWR